MATLVLTLLLARPELAAAEARIEEIVRQRPLAAADLEAIDRILQAVPAAALEAHQTKSAAVRRALRAIVFARGPGRSLGERWRIGLLYTSDDGRDGARGARLVCKEPFTPDVERLAATLAKDKRAPWRLGAGRLAKLLVQIRGQSPACERIALELLKQDDAVAVTFAGMHAWDFHSVAVVDALAGRARHPERPVGRAARDRLHAEFYMWRHWSGRKVQPVRRRGRLSVVGTWRRKKEAGFVFGCDPDQFVRTVDQHAVLEVGVPARLKRVWVLLEEFSEGWQADQPVFSAVLVVSHDRERRDLIERSGPNNANDGFPLRSMAGKRLGAAGGPAYEAFLAPTHQGKVRIRFRYWERP